MRARRPRPVLGLVLAALALFVLFGGDSGVAGRLVHDGISFLLGGFGRALLVVVLFAAAWSLGTPAGTAARLARLVRRRSPRAVRSRVPLSEAITTSDLSAEGRRRLDEVRAAMKALGFEKREYEALVASMDPRLPLERLVRDGITGVSRSREASS